MAVFKLLIGFDRLLEAGADGNAAKYPERTALQVALEGDHRQVVELLLKAGATVEEHQTEWMKSTYGISQVPRA